MSATTTYGWLPIGDSITYGWGSPGGYRSKLIDALIGPALSGNYKLQSYGPSNENSTATQIQTNTALHCGFPGYTTDQIMANLQGSFQPPGGWSNKGGFWLGTPQAPARWLSQIKIITLLAGTNDIIQNVVTPQFATLVAEKVYAIADVLHRLMPNAFILIMNLPPLTSKPGAADSVNYNLNTLPGRSYSKIVNPFDIQFSNPLYANLMTLEGIHPNDCGYCVMGNKLALAVAPIVNPKFPIPSFNQCTTCSPLIPQSQMIVTAKQRVNEKDRQYSETAPDSTHNVFFRKKMYF